MGGGLLMFPEDDRPVGRVGIVLGVERVEERVDEKDRIAGAGEPDFFLRLLAGAAQFP